LLEGGLEDLARFVLAARIRVETQYAERHRNAGQVLAAADLDQFEAPAAKVADNSIGFWRARSNAFASEKRFLLGAQHLAIESDPLDLADEFVTVLGIADRGGRDDVCARDLHMVDQQAEAAKRGERLFARFLG
jgi:hypothetical protein